MRCYNFILRQPNKQSLCRNARPQLALPEVSLLTTPTRPKPRNVLSFDRSYKAPQGLTDGSLLGQAAKKASGVRVDGEQRGKKKQRPPKKGKGGSKTKEWILHKKDTQRKKGKDVKKDTKYTGRKRPTRF